LGRGGENISAGRGRGLGRIGLIPRRTFEEGESVRGEINTRDVLKERTTSYFRFLGFVMRFGGAGGGGNEKTKRFWTKVGKQAISSRIGARIRCSLAEGGEASGEQARGGKTVS